MYIEELYEEEKISSWEDVSQGARAACEGLSGLTTVLGIPRPSSFLQ